jgi:hypothetical protein
VLPEPSGGGPGGFVIRTGARCGGAARGTAAGGRGHPLRWREAGRAGVLRRGDGRATGPRRSRGDPGPAGHCLSAPGTGGPDRRLPGSAVRLAAGGWACLFRSLLPRPWGTMGFWAGGASLCYRACPVRMPANAGCRSGVERQITPKRHRQRRETPAPKTPSTAGDNGSALAGMSGQGAVYLPASRHVGCRARCLGLPGLSCGPLPGPAGCSPACALAGKPLTVKRGCGGGSGSRRGGRARRSGGWCCRGAVVPGARCGARAARGFVRDEMIWVD